MGGHQRAHAKRQGQPPAAAGQARGATDDSSEAGRPGHLSPAVPPGCVLAELVRVEADQGRADAASPGTVR